MAQKNGIGKKGRPREFVVVGLGRFGSSVAETLTQYGHDVLGIDCSAERVQHLSRDLPHIVQLDATNAEALRQIGIGQFETAVVAISGNFESNLLATVLLRRFGVEHIITKARTRLQKTILLEVGAAQVILPEHDAGVHLARRLSSQHFIDFLEIRDGISVVEMMAPESLFGCTLAESNLRQRLGLNVIAVNRDSGIIPNPRADFRIEAGDVLLVLGRIEDVEMLRE
ncbi:MAG: TrkA family potassium uptake protein [Chloroflexi bacterium]|nr:TrkA family potassium uptake protein [Chloroflexota bacterium]